MSSGLSLLAHLFSHPWWNETNATWALVAVGIVGTVAAVRTLNTIKKQTTAIEQQTTAVQKQGDALINSDRAWIGVQLQFTRERKLFSENGIDTSGTFELHSQNFGRTSGWLYEQRIQMFRGTPAENPDVEKNVFATKTDLIPIAPSQQLLTFNLTLGVNGKIDDRGGHIYGVVKYRDAFQEKRQTFFGYTVSANGELKPIPGPLYNRHT